MINRLKCAQENSKNLLFFDNSSIYCTVSSNAYFINMLPSNLILTHINHPTIYHLGIKQIKRYNSSLLF